MDTDLYPIPPYPAVKTRFIMWLLLEMLVAAVMSTTTSTLRRDHHAAVVAWKKNPTPETAGDWRSKSA